MLPPYFMVVHRPQKGVMAWLLRRAMPRDTRPIFVWPKLVVAIEGYFHRRWLVAIAVLLIAVTIVIAKALLLVPGLDNSVVGLLTSIFETFLPARWATGAAWVAGMTGVFLIQNTHHHRSLYTVSEQLNGECIMPYCSSHYGKSKLSVLEVRSGAGANECALACASELST